MLDSNARILALETSGQTGSVAIGTPAGLIAAETLPVDVRHAAELMPAVQRLLHDQNWPADSITDVFISIGPGSFTGLRIAVTVARTLAWSVGAKVVAVPTMHALARNALQCGTGWKPVADRLEAGPTQEGTGRAREGTSPTQEGAGRTQAGVRSTQGSAGPPHVAMIVDAKRSQVYTACYRIEENRCVEVIPACLAEPREFLTRCPQPIAVLGEGIPRHREAIEAAGAILMPDHAWAGRAESIFAVGLEMANAGAYTPARELVPLYIRRPEMEERWEARQKAAKQTNT